MKRSAALLRFLFRPHFLICFGFAWMITNGWAYVLTALGLLLDIPPFYTLGAGYLALLWLPFTPEKILTAMIAVHLLKRFFPEDRETLRSLLRISGREEKRGAELL